LDLYPLIKVSIRSGQSLGKEKKLHFPKKTTQKSTQV